LGEFLFVKDFTQLLSAATTKAKK